MTQFIKGDLKLFKSCHLDLIYNVLKYLKLKGKEIIIEPIGKPGDNMASDVRIIKINEGNLNIFNIIVKLASYPPENPVSNLSHVLFSNEILMCREVLKMLNQLQENARVNLKHKFKIIDCYGTISDKSNEIILLEYLPKEKYTMLDKYDPMSHETVQLVLKNLAIYHSLSYALKNKRPQLYFEYCEKLTCMYTLEENIKNASKFAALGDDLSKIFDDSKYERIVKTTFTQQMDEVIKLVETEKKSRYSVFIHGDCWTNNILFKLKDGVPDECIFIDYQLAREAHPVADILHFIFNCTDYKTRVRYYDDWLDVYCKQLEKNLLTFDLNINDVYPRERLDLDLKRYSQVTLGIAMFAASVVLRESTESSKMRDTLSEVEDFGDMLGAFKTSSLNKDSVLKIKNKIEGLIDSCIELGYVI